MILLANAQGDLRPGRVSRRGLLLGAGAASVAASLRRVQAARTASALWPAATNCSAAVRNLMPHDGRPAPPTRPLQRRLSVEQKIVRQGGAARRWG